MGMRRAAAAVLAAGAAVARAAPAAAQRPCTADEAAARSWCEYNGDCVCTHSCACRCAAAWRGATCGDLALLPAPPPAPLASGGAAPLPAYPPPTLLNTTPPTSSWGGGVVLDPATGKWNMFVSEFANQCGLSSWGTNSAIVRAVSDTPAGPYRRAGVLLPPFAHNPSVARAPDGTFVVWHIGCGRPKGGNPYLRPCDCTPGAPHGCNRTSEEPGCTRNSTDILFANSTEGPWRRWEAVEGPSSFFQVDNPAPYFFPNGSVLMLGRDGKASCRVITAPSWRGPYTLHKKEIGHHGNIPNVEDPFLWRDGAGRFHALFHKFAHPNVSAHAFSLDGLDWEFGRGVPYTSSLQGADGAWRDFGRRERPHLIFDARGAPTHLLTGLVVSGHLSVTHAQPIRTA